MTETIFRTANDDIVIERLPGGQARVRLDRVMMETTANEIMVLLLAEMPPERISALTPEESQENHVNFLGLKGKLAAEELAEARRKLDEMQAVDPT